MTPAQQSALETIAGRALTPGELVAIDALLEVRDDVQIANIISAGRTRIVPTPIGIGTVLAVMAPSGGDFLNSLDTLGATDANVKWSLKMIEQATFDVGHPITREQLQAFAVAQPALADAIGALLAVAQQPDPIPFTKVSDALNKVAP